jgi:hypothetical protein
MMSLHITCHEGARSRFSMENPMLKGFQCFYSSAPNITENFPPLTLDENRVETEIRVFFPRGDIITLFSGSHPASHLVGQ